MDCSGAVSARRNKAETYLPDAVGGHAFLNQESRSFLIPRAWLDGTRKGMVGPGTAEQTHPNLALLFLTPFPVLDTVPDVSRRHSPTPQAR